MTIEASISCHVGIGHRLVGTHLAKLEECEELSSED